ncbi:MarR family winged helix-turn-helix transcriptional regulator [Streptococcus halotolerans]|uniref:MarR family winged helix-turn-helix transcriptional regulator n=1 Tax=Streptococcus halotolerans TaxID=1814128 RepID=UPI0007879649|nr:MarR family transcriptional regulator [Streptococcus halotolerans]
MPQDVISVLIKRASLALDKKANAFLNPYGLTYAQFKILEYVAHHDELSVTQKMIEDRFSMTNPTVTGIIQNLEKKDLIYRQQNPNDGRSKVLGLTQKTKDLKPHLHAAAHNINQDFTKSLDPDQQETLAQLLKLLIADH